MESMISTGSRPVMRRVSISRRLSMNHPAMLLCFLLASITSGLRSQSWGILARLSFLLSAAIWSHGFEFFEGMVLRILRRDVPRTNQSERIRKKMINVNLIIRNSVDLTLCLCAIICTYILMEAMAAVLERLKCLSFIIYLCINHVK